MWAHPLQWPEHWGRTEEPRYSPFSATVHSAKMGLDKELRLLGAIEPIVTTNLKLGTSGWPLTPRRAADRPTDTGVAVYFTLDGRELVFPCDKWNLVEDNMHAIELTIGALRGIERWGAKEMMDHAFRGYVALPAGPNDLGQQWWETLEVAANASIDQINSAYRRLARRYHPDLNPSDASAVVALQRINDAYEQAREALA